VTRQTRRPLRRRGSRDQASHGWRSQAPLAGIATGPTTDWASVPASVPFRNEGDFFVDGRPLRRQPNLAICQDRVEGGVTLLFCDSRWNIRAVGVAPSVAAAKRSAERLYPGLLPFWRSASMTERHALAYMQALRDEMGCSFCGRAPAEHGGSLVERGTARICSACVAEIHAHSTEGTDAPSAPHNNRMHLRARRSTAPRPRR
jgi:hypothetical protein